MKSIGIIGSTGSIGVQALDVIKNRGYSVKALAANNNAEILEEQIRVFKPDIAALYDEKAAKDLKLRVADTSTNVSAGESGVLEAASLKVDILLNSVVGIAGLKPTLAALEAGNTLALANKESLVCAGDIVMKLAKDKNLAVLPVDSEHSAVFQALGTHKINEVEKIILTASGGPFYFSDEKELPFVTPEDALKHPSWKMGKKITIDCATMMNKGFELIEAKFLFGADISQLTYVIHRESLVHSLVKFKDKSIVAQISPPDMRLPIVYALDYPVRHRTDLADFDFFNSKISFLPPREDVFKAPSICLEALKRGGTLGAVINGANEAAVKLFLEKKIRFTDITELVSDALSEIKNKPANNPSDVFEADAEARRYIFDKVVR
ncbi:MAG: 1-deoxy-D-xylulose-5-phosphate reductoisomerase [Clostridia bacterium]|nr:1-deoxy-D-xylulose-5-phosphate reductoisomerase [Clostridia bacterium]